MVSLYFTVLLCFWLHSGQKRSYEPGNLHCTGHTLLNVPVYIWDLFASCWGHQHANCFLCISLSQLFFPVLGGSSFFFLISAHLQRKHNTISSVHFCPSTQTVPSLFEPPLSHYFAKNNKEHLTCYKVLSIYNHFPWKSRWHLGAVLWQFCHGITMVNGFAVCPRVFPVYHWTQCLLRNALFWDTAIPSAVDFSRVLFQGHDVSCDLKCPDNRSAQGLLPTLSWWSHSKFLLSKSNKQWGTEAPTAFLPISLISWVQQWGQISSCAVLTHELCCFGLWKISFILLALRRWSIFFFPG